MADTQSDLEIDDTPEPRRPDDRHRVTAVQPRGERGAVFAPVARHLVRRTNRYVHPDVSRAINLILIDTLLVTGTLCVTAVVPMTSTTRLVLIAQVAVWWLLMAVLGGYDVINRRGARRSVTMKALVLSCVAQLLFDAWQSEPARKEVLVALAFLSLGSMLGRTLVDRIGRERVLAVSTAAERPEALDTLIINRGPVLDVALTAIVERAELINASVVEIQPDCRLSRQNVQQLCWELRLARVSLRFPVDTGPADARRIDHVPDRRGVMIELRPPHASWGARVAKRTLDVVVATALLLVLVPVLLTLGLLVRTTSAGPALYLQERIGRDGRPFRMIKFRSMVVDADARLHGLLEAQGKGAVPLFKVDDDPRLTKAGAVMRRYSLDELPQLLNVLAGSMSLVGPRPQRRSEVDLYDALAAQRLGVLPGMTGLWQVSGRSRLSWEQAIALDVSYVHNWSLRHDLGILARTAKAVVSSDGAV